MKTLALLEGKAKTLNQHLPEGSLFTIRSAYDGYQIAFEGRGTNLSNCGYERKSVAIAQFDAIWTVLDGFKHCKCTQAEVDTQMGAFFEIIETRTETLDQELTLLGNLAGALMRELNPDRASAIIQQVVAKAHADGILDDVIEV